MYPYAAPLRDIRFVLHEVLHAGNHYAELGREDVNAEFIDTVLEGAARFAEEVVAPTNEPGDRIGVRLEDGKVITPPGFKEAYQRYCEDGWITMKADPDWGGQGMPGGFALAFSEMLISGNMAWKMYSGLTESAVLTIESHASDELKQAYLPKMVSGEWAGTMCLTEAHAGSDLGILRTKAEPRGDGSYAISGTKIFITWGDHELSENIIHFVLARIEGAPEGVRGISMFLVPKFLVDDNGEVGERNDLRATSLEHKLGIHASPTAVMSFGDNDGAIGYLIGEEGKGLATMFTMMNHARLGVGQQGLAVSERAFQLARAYAHDRVQGRVPGHEGRAPIVHHADVRRMLMLMRSQIEAMRAVIYTAAAQVDLAHHASSDEARAAAESRLSLLTPVVKGWCTEKSEEVTSLGIQVHGGMGYVEETGAAQHYRDARILPIYEGTNGIQAADLAGRKVLGDEGREIRKLVGELRETCAGMQGDEALAAIAASVGAGLDQLEQGVDWILANAMSDPAALGASSFNFLMLAGTVLGGALLARSAAAAVADTGGTDAGFAKEKVATTAFYCTHVLPRAHGYLAAMTADPAITMALPAEAFLD